MITYFLCIYLYVLPQSVHCSLPAQCTQVCSDVSCRYLSKLCNVHGGAHGHSLTQNRQDGLSLQQCWCTDDHLL